MPNVENINKVIDAIRTAGTGEYEGLGFNMFDFFSRTKRVDPEYDDIIDRSGHDCGTVACIGGWAYALSVDETEDFWALGTSAPAIYIMDSAAEFLGLSETESRALFIPYVPCPLTRITVNQAIATLERLRDTGEVVWELGE